MRLGRFVQGFGGMLVVTATMTFGGTALAGPPDPIERAGDRQELREDRRETAADRWDLARLKALHGRYLAARGASNGALLGVLDREIMTELRVEVRETKIETAEKAHEVRASAGERNGERREVVEDVARGRPLEAARDAKDLRDDRRDLRDDRRDLAAEVASLHRKLAIRDAYAPLVARLDRASVQQKVVLIERAIALAKLEVRQDVKEKAEDERELREDRRDRRLD